MTINFDKEIPLLSFIYRLYTDGEFQARFKTDPEVAMDEYKLNWEQKIAIYHSGANPVYLSPGPVPGYPRTLDPAKASPNPISADWWAEYAQFIAATDAGGNPAPVPNPRVNDRSEGDRVSMAGVMLLLGEELSKKIKWKLMWT
jgi:hypothetical protein